LVLGRSADAALGGQAGKKLANLNFTHFRRVALTMEKDKAL
jgi:hypothetical protein